MSVGSSIEWTDATWNPVRGCVKVSAGCKHCYAETFAERWRGVAGHPYEQGFDLRLVPEKLDEPLRWRKPRRVFVNSMSDLFQDGVPFEFIAAVYGVMAVSKHTFQVLTKRPERRLAFYNWLAQHADRGPTLPDLVVQRYAYRALREKFPPHPIKGTCRAYPWPLLNVWEGVSTENQETADERIPLLLQTPAAVRFVSAEPLLSAIDFTWIAQPDDDADGVIDALRGKQWVYGDERCAAGGHFQTKVWRDGEEIIWREDVSDSTRLDWIIVGGESGPGARPCEVSLIRSIVEQCRAAGVACFVKQLGARAWDNRIAVLYGIDEMSPEHLNANGRKLRDRKGGDPAEWPEDLRVREMPR